MTDQGSSAKTPEDRVFKRKLGAEIRAAREDRGWTRAELSQRLPSGVGERTLLAYEHGGRGMSAARLVEICRELGADAGALMNRAVSGTASYHTAPMRINLSALIDDSTEGYSTVRVWAKSRLEDASTTVGAVVAVPAVVETLARVAGCSHRTLAAYLTNFLAPDMSQVHWSEQREERAGGNQNQ